MAVSKLLHLLDEINDILRKHHVQRWLNVLLDIKTRLQKIKDFDNPSQILVLLEEIRDLFGGMGSFNDLFITNQAGHDILPEDVNTVNSRFQTLQTELFLEVKEEIAQLNSSKNV